MSTIIPATNNCLQGHPVSEGEFIRYIGVWLLMSTVNAGTSRRSFWSHGPVDPFAGAPFRCHDFMSGNRFEIISKSLKYTSKELPGYSDKIFEVRELLDAFNQNMRKIFNSGWVVCLDESMSQWTRQWTCPGFVYCPRKPHPKGNEYHTIADGISGILFELELVEEKDEPPEMYEKKKFKEFGKTAGSLLRLCEIFFGSMKVVILDSGFCVLKAIIELRKRGVFAASVIKKRKYWPKYIPGDNIKELREKDPIGTQARLPGKIDGINFDVFTSREPDYVTMFMSIWDNPSQTNSRKKD